MLKLGKKPVSNGKCWVCIRHNDFDTALTECRINSESNVATHALFFWILRMCECSRIGAFWLQNLCGIIAEQCDNSLKAFGKGLCLTEFFILLQLKLCVCFIVSCAHGFKTSNLSKKKKKKNLSNLHQNKSASKFFVDGIFGHQGNLLALYSFFILTLQQLLQRYGNNDQIIACNHDVSSGTILSDRVKSQSPWYCASFLWLL